MATIKVQGVDVVDNTFHTAQLQNITGMTQPTWLAFFGHRGIQQPNMWMGGHSWSWQLATTSGIFRKRGIGYSVPIAWGMPCDATSLLLRLKMYRENTSATQHSFRVMRKRNGSNSIIHEAGITATTPTNHDITINGILAGDCYQIALQGGSVSNTNGYNTSSWTTLVEAKWGNLLTQPKYPVHVVNWEGSYA